jgi:hypothetical protein
VLRSLVALVVLGAGLAQAQNVPAEKPFVPLNRWALVVGASAYSKDIGPLQYTSKEARDFAGELNSHLGFNDENIRVLADGATPEEAPTSAHILGALDDLLKNPRLDKGNLFIFYFSGHGVGTAKGDFLLPSDVTPDRIEEMGVPLKDVIARIVHAGLKNVLFIADACRAGQANDFGKQFIELCRQANLAVILGCEPGKRSYEYPRLKSGAFTHFLIQALEKPELRDESGTLWASKLGVQVQKQVHDYTEPDYGDSAQVPALWGEQSTLDVLLATYPQKPVSDLAVAAFRKSAEKLDKAEFAASMTEYAAQLQTADRFDQSVEILKAVDQLGELTPMGRFLLGNSLGLLGRPGEANKVFTQLESEPDSYFKDLALICTNSRAIAPKLRVQAATRILQMDTPWPDKMLAWVTVGSCGTYEEKLHFVRTFAAMDASPRRKLYAEGCRADIEGKWKDSVAAFEKARKEAGDYPAESELLNSEVHPIVASGDTSVLRAWIEKAIKTKGCEGPANLERAALASQDGDTKTEVESLKQVFLTDTDPYNLWRAALVAGSHIRDLKGEIRTAAEKNPYSWRARLLLSFVKQLDGDKTADKDLDISSLYLEDPLTYTTQTFELLNSLLEEGVRLGKVSQADYRRQIDFSFLGLLGSTSQFGYDADVWGQFLSLGMLDERNTQMQLVLSRSIPFEPASAPATLRPLLLLNALNQGDDAMVEKLNAVPYEPTEGDDPKWMYACYLATKGHFAKAAALIAPLKPGSPELAPRMEAMRTYLLAKNGHAGAARTRLKLKPVDDFVVRGFDGLAWAALGDWKHAEPLLSEQAKSRNWAFLFVSAFATQVLDQHYRQAGRLQDSRMMAFYGGGSQPANRLFQKFSFVTKPGVAQFAGDIKMHCTIEDDILCAKSMLAEGEKTYEIGDLNISIKKTGAVAGAFTDQEMNRYPFAGKIDELGNFRGSANLKGRKFRIAAKLAPPPIYKNFAAFKHMGQVIEFVDEQGYRVVVVGLMD